MNNSINVNPRSFYIVRKNDETGTSGVGRVLDGVLWHNGWVSIVWRTDLDPLKRGMSSLTFFDTFDAFKKIHIDAHPSNDTEIVWTDEEIESLKDKNKDLRKQVRELKAEVKELKNEK